MGDDPNSVASRMALLASAGSSSRGLPAGGGPAFNPFAGGGPQLQPALRKTEPRSRPQERKNSHVMTRTMSVDQTDAVDDSVFQLFTEFSINRDSREGVDSSGFKKLLEYGHIVNRKMRAPEAMLMFDRVKLRGKSAIDFRGFKVPGRRSEH
jgi:hypothetical protein